MLIFTILLIVVPHLIRPDQDLREMFEPLV